MGDRFFISVNCTKCSFKEDDVYYAPTCGFTEWVCPKCGKVVDLEEYTGISYEDASNRDLIEQIVDSRRHCTQMVGEKKGEE